MDSLSRYETSREELLRIDEQSNAADEFIIKISKLDSISKERLLLAIHETVSQRIKDIDRVTLGVKNDYQDF